jgi:hypothetical protein
MMLKETGITCSAILMNSPKLCINPMLPMNSVEIDL